MPGFMLDAGKDSDELAHLPQGLTAMWGDKEMNRR